jgi:hypothetical protein
MKTYEPKSCRTNSLALVLAVALVIPVVTGDKAAAQTSIATEKELRTKAEQGDQEAQYFLGLKYSKGDGVATNRIEGYKWLHIAVESGNRNALLARWEAGKSMTPDEIAEATRLASALPLPGAALSQGNSHSPVSTKKPESKRTPSEILAVLRSSKSDIRVGPTADIGRWQADVENQKTDRVLRLGGGDGLFFVSDVKSALGEPDKITVEDAPGFSNSNTGEQLKGDVFWYGRVGLGFTPFSAGDLGPGLFYLRYQPAGTNRAAATDVQLSAETNYEFTISWKGTIASPIRVTNVPPISYKTVGRPSVTNVLVVPMIAAGKPADLTNSWRLTLGDRNFSLLGLRVAEDSYWLQLRGGTPNFISQSTGELDSQSWAGPLFFLTTLHKYQGSGTLRVALFEVKESKEKQFDPGRQLSEWIGLTLRISDKQQ